jgi:RNA polymerase sigma factor (sigma-70 family)
MFSGNLIDLITKDYLSLIYGYALRRTNNREDAEDLAQDILTELVSSVNNLRDQKAYNSFIWAVAGNTYKRWLKKHKNSGCEYIENYQAAGIYNVEDIGDIEDSLVNLEEINQLRREISLLSKTYREIVVMYYIDEMSCSEIAQKLNLTVDTVKYFLYKARNIMKDGISMNREFGEKSYKPAEFSIMYRGEYSVDYYDLSKRKLPGNILLTAMDKPVSISEIGVETGVPVTYLEDEISILEDKGLISNVKVDKYQTSIIVFTRKLNEIIDSILKKYAKGAAEDLYNGFIKIEEEFRKTTSTDPEINRDRLLWTILPIILCLDIADVLHSENIKTLPLLKQGNHGLVWGSESTVKPWDWGITSKSVTKYAGKGGRYAILIDFAILGTENQKLIGKEEIKLISISKNGRIPLGELNELEKETAARMIENGYVSNKNGILKFEGVVFDHEQGEESKRVLKDILSLYTNYLKAAQEEVSNIMTIMLPKHLHEQVEAIAYIKTMSSMMSAVIEEMVAKSYLNIPKEKDKYPIGCYIRV